MFSRNLWFGVLITLSLLGRVILTPSAYSGDINNHIGWADSILKSGFSGAYDRQYRGVMQPTYPPLAVYAFTTSTGLYHGLNSLFWYANDRFPAFPSGLIWYWERQQILPAFNKAIAVFSDIGVGILIYIFIRHLRPSRPGLAWAAAFAYLFNPAVLYTSTIWGQIETMPLFFLLLSLWYLYRRRFTSAHLAMAAALLSKQSVIIFFPVFLFMSWQMAGWRRTLIGLTVQLGCLYLAYFPFYSGKGIFWPVQVYLHRITVGSGSDYISDHAFNLWALYSHLNKLPDSKKVIFGLTAGSLAAATFISTYFIFLYSIIKKKFSWPLIFTLLSLIPGLAFMLMTRMHERYLAPVLPFLVLTAAFYPRIWVVYAGISLVHLANLYHIWWFPRWEPAVAWLSAWPNLVLLIILLSGSFLFLIYTYVQNLRRRI